MDIKVKYLYFTLLSTLPRKTVWFPRFSGVNSLWNSCFILSSLTFVTISFNCQWLVDDEESTTQPQTRAKELGGFDSTKPVQELQNRKRDPHRKNIMHLWEFLLELLAKEICRSVITWTRKDNLEFKIKNPQELARKWGAFKNRVGMSYETLSRSLRYYYKQRIIKKVGAILIIFYPEYFWLKMPDLIQGFHPQN